MKMTKDDVRTIDAYLWDDIDELLVQNVPSYDGEAFWDLLAEHLDIGRGTTMLLNTDYLRDWTRRYDTEVIGPALDELDRVFGEGKPTVIRVFFNW